MVAINGFFVAAEFAMVRAHPTKLREPENREKLGVKSALKLIENLDLSLSSTQLGITIASLVLGWWGEFTFQRVFVDFFRLFGEDAARVLSHGVATALALIVITFLHVVLGEVAAKSYAIRHPEQILRWIAFPLLLFSQLFRPLIRFLTVSAMLFLRLFGVKTTPESERVHSLGEIAMLITHSSERGLLAKEEQEMLQGIFGFSETVAREVMTPRTDLVTLNMDMTFDELVSRVIQSGHSRFPVIGESVDQIVGVFISRDLLPLLNHARSGTFKDFNLKRYLREPYFVPGTKPIDDLLSEFKRRSVHIAVVLDEHGGVDGVVTLEDIIEEIVGDIFDESDVAQKDIVIDENGDVIVDGGVLVADINNRFDIEIPEGDYDTIAGFVLTSLGRMPKPGEQVLVNKEMVVPVNGQDPNGVEAAIERLQGESNGAEKGGDGDAESAEEKSKALITVEKVTGHRIEKVRVQHIKPVEKGETREPLAASQS